MKIVLTASVEEPVPPKKYGGTETIVYLLSREYLRLGHDVYLLASGDSQTPAKLIPIIPQSIRQKGGKDGMGTWREFWKYVNVARQIEEINKIKPDFIHNHLSWRLIAFENIIQFPMLSTVHGPIASREAEGFQLHKDHPYISISDNQRKAMPGLNWMGTVYNGIDIDAFPYNEKRDNREYYIFLGRTSPEKGLAEIVRMIKGTHHKLKIAAKIDEVDRAYYEKEVKPYVDGEQIEYVGEVGHSGKTDLLKKAKALLLWLNWEEPFGLVVPEANACGTPVIVNKRGSMPELVQDCANGYLVSSIEEMKTRLDDVGKLNPRDCRTWVEGNFTARIMAERYLALAEKILRN